MAEVNLDAMDVAGEQQSPTDHSLMQQRLSASGVPVDEPVLHLLPAEVQQIEDEKQRKTVPVNACGSCYGAETSTRKVRFGSVRAKVVVVALDAT